MENDFTTVGRRLLQGGLIFGSQIKDHLKKMCGMEKKALTCIEIHKLGIFISNEQS